MSVKGAEVVRCRDGLRGVLEPDAAAGAGGATRVVRLDDGRTLVVSSSLLTTGEGGGYELPLGLLEIEHLAGRTGGSVAPVVEERAGVVARTSKARVKAEAGGVVVPVVEEQAEVRTERVVTGRVRVSKKVTEHTEVVDLPMNRAVVDVQRVKVDRVVDAPAGPRHEGDTLIVPVYEEVVVVETRLMLREEVRITTRREESRTTQKITLRREEAVVDRSETGAE